MFIRKRNTCVRWRETRLWAAMLITLALLALDGAGVLDFSPWKFALLIHLAAWLAAKHR